MCQIGLNRQLIIHALVEGKDAIIGNPHFRNSLVLIMYLLDISLQHWNILNVKVQIA